ncbi:MAG: hypothetical protein JJ911_15660 [Rhizobiaceae bacterium]|nr:hypothetical protein [Rhizobiaceae bacterium]
MIEVEAKIPRTAADALRERGHGIRLSPYIPSTSSRADHMLCSASRIQQTSLAMSIAAEVVLMG